MISDARERLKKAGKGGRGFEKKGSFPVEAVFFKTPLPLSAQSDVGASEFPTLQVNQELFNDNVAQDKFCDGKSSRPLGLLKDFCRQNSLLCDVEVLGSS